MQKEDPVKANRRLRGEVVSLKKQVRDMKAQVDNADIVVRIKEGEIEELKGSLRGARAVARLLARAYTTNQQAPEQILEEALSYPRE